MRPGGTKSILVALIAVTVALAGCTSSDNAAPQEVPETDFSEFEVEATAETGVIRGVVVDAAIRPIAAVTVTVTGPDGADSVTDYVAETAESGAFAFGKLEPGVYTVRAEKLGYVAATQQTDVLAGLDEPPVVKLLLETDPSTRPSFQVFKFDGFIDCSITAVILSFMGCSLLPLSTEFLAEHQIEGEPEFIQSELIFESTQALGDHMSLSITDLQSDPQRRIAAESGPSPVLVSVNKTLIQEFGIGTNLTASWRVFSTDLEETDPPVEEAYEPVWQDTVYPAWNSTVGPAVQDGSDAICDATGCILGAGTNPAAEECIKYPALFDACMGFGGVGVVFQQEFTFFTHAFHNMLPPEGWQFSQDNDPALP